MKRQILRAATVVTILATCVSATSVAANADDGPSPLLDGAIEITIGAIRTATGTCTAGNITFKANDEPTPTLYYGVPDSLWEWTEGVTVDGCSGGHITATGTLTDQPLDGQSGSLSGSQTVNGTGHVALSPTVVQRYSTVDLATGLTYHTIAINVRATQVYGTTDTRCMHRDWTYQARATGPVFVGSTPMTTTRCA